ncbi:MAG: SoxR reducing system RseC family protein [Clostridia bacterium]|nr:SoxR reducing system RseC family protein [Clostridia bacterium]
MKQSGIVLKTDGEFATVEVMQSSACAGCSKQEGCVSCKKKTKAVAYNPIGAVKGDKVILETKSSTVLLYALLVFVLPLLLCGLGYYISFLLGAVQIISFIVSACIFGATYVIIYFIVDRRGDTKKSVVITDLVKN